MQDCHSWHYAQRYLEKDAEGQNGKDGLTTSQKIWRRKFPI